MLYSKSEQEIIRAVKRKQAVFENVGRLVGIVSLVAIVAFSARAIHKRMLGKAKASVIAAQLARDEREAEIRPSRPTQASSAEPQVVDLSRRGTVPAATPAKVPMVDLAKPTGKSEAAMVSAAIPGGTAAPLPPEKQQKIAETVKAFFEARSVNSFLPLVRDAERVKPLMERFYRTNSFRPYQWTGIAWIVPVEEKGYQFSYVQSLFEGAPPVNVFVEESATGEYRVDWESTVHYCDMSWKEFQSVKPTEPKMFRLIASRAESGDVAAGGDARQATLRLKHPKEGGVIYGSFDKSDPRFGPLLQQLELSEWKDTPVIVRLCYPGQATASGVAQIAAVEGKGWLILDVNPHS